jgi:hypothetical protein
MRSSVGIVGVILIAALFAGSLAAQDVQLPLKSIQVKHFGQADGLGLSQEFINYFYDGLMTYMPKTKVATAVTGEEAIVPEADAANSVVVEGTIIELKNKGMAGILRAEINLYRLSDRKLVKTFTSEVAFKRSPLNKEKNIAEPAGGNTAFEIKKALKKL